MSVDKNWSGYLSPNVFDGIRVITDEEAKKILESAKRLKERSKENE